MSFNIVKLTDPIQFTNVAGGLVPKGAYDNGTDYAVGDSVDYNGSSYVMHTNAGAGTVPTNTSYWQVLANKGDTGATGATGPAGADGLTVSVNSVTQVGGNITIDPDDLDDTSTTNKFVTAADITKLSNLSGTNTGDQDLSGYLTSATASSTYLPLVGGTLSGNLNINGTSSTNGVLTVTDSTTVTNTKLLTLLNSSLSNSQAFVDIGKAITTNNYGRIYFTHSSDGSVNNSIVMQVGGGTAQIKIFSGAIQHEGGFYPSGNNTLSLGLTTRYYANTYTQRLCLNSTAYLDGATGGRMDAVGNFYINSNGQARLFSTRAGANSNGSNIFIGGGGQNSIGAVGQGWLGSSNVSLGVNALNALTTGDNNVAVGVSALQANTTGYSNSAVGTNALLANTSGSGNMALGLASLQANTTGVNNLGIGVRALTANTTGYGNIALGEDAGRWLANGSTTNQTAGNSIYIGTATKASAAGGQNETVIGSTAIGNGSNTVTIGNSSVTGNFFTGNIESTTTSASVILKSPDGTRYKLSVANGGTLTITAA